jgi:hypothetical protein
MAAAPNAAAQNIASMRTSGHNGAHSITIPSGTTLLVVLSFATHFTTCQAATFTFDGNAMTAVPNFNPGSIAFGAPCRLQAHYYVNPAAGTFNVTPAYSGTGGVSRSYIGCMTYDGSDTTTPVEGGNNSTTTPYAASGSVKSIAPTTTTVNGDYLVGGGINFGGGVGDLSSNGTDIGEAYDTNNGTIINFAHKALTGSGQSIGWTDLTFYNGANACFVIKAAGGGGGSAIVPIVVSQYRMRK